MANFIETETTTDGVTHYTKKVGVSTYYGVVEPTFTDGEWSAVFTDDFNDAVTEKLFSDEDEAHFWVMRKMLKAN